MTTISFVQHLSVRNAIIYYINGQTIFGDKKKSGLTCFIVMNTEQMKL